MTRVADTAAQTISETADRIEERRAWQNKADFVGGAGPCIYVELFETAKRITGWTAVQHVAQHLHLDQLQHWEEKDPAIVIEALREAAGEAVTSDMEAAAARAEVERIRVRLSAAVGYLTVDSSFDLLKEVERRLARLAELERSAA